MRCEKHQRPLGTIYCNLCAVEFEREENDQLRLEIECLRDELRDVDKWLHAEPIVKCSKPTHKDEKHTGFCVLWLDHDGDCAHCIVLNDAVQGVRDET